MHSSKKWIDKSKELPKTGKVEFVMCSDFSLIRIADVFNNPMNHPASALWLSNKGSIINDSHITHWRYLDLENC